MTDTIITNDGTTEIITEASVINVVPAGGGSNESAPCGEIISGHLAVVMIAGLLYMANPTNPAHAGKVVGMAAQSGSQIGAVIEYVSLGDLGAFGTVLTQDDFYFVGLGGAPSTTQKAPGAVWWQYLGFAKDSATMHVDPGPAVTF